MKKFLTSLAVFSLPLTSRAQNEIVNSNLGDFIRDIQGFINEILIPLIFTLSLLGFLFGVYRYFITGKASETDREEGKKYMIWAVIGFVIMVSIWGIVALFAGAIPQSEAVTPPTF